MDKEKRMKLLESLRLMTQVRGQVRMSAECEAKYVEWYNVNQKQRHENKQFSGYYERKPDHAIRIAMLLSISGSKQNHLTMEWEQLDHAIRILDWVEKWLPATFDSLQESTAGAATMNIIKQLKSRNGTEKHSTLLRLNCRKMNAVQFKEAINTCIQAGMIIADTKTRQYLLTPEGWRA